MRPKDIDRDVNVLFRAPGIVTNGKEVINMGTCKKCGNVCAHGRKKCNACTCGQIQLTQAEINGMMLELCAVED